MILIGVHTIWNMRIYTMPNVRIYMTPHVRTYMTPDVRIYMTPNARPKNLNIPFFLDIMIFRNLWVPPFFSNVPLFPVFMNFMYFSVPLIFPMSRFPELQPARFFLRSLCVQWVFQSSKAADATEYTNGHYNTSENMQIDVSEGYTFDRGCI